MYFNSVYNVGMEYPGIIKIYGIRLQVDIDSQHLIIKRKRSGYRILSCQVERRAVTGS
jgi:hypothetical protein